MDIFIEGGCILTPYRRFKGAVLIRGDRIERVYVGDNYEVPHYDMRIDARGLYVSPGFFDTHTHGAGGYDVSDGKRESFLGMGMWKKRMGVTTFLPTTIALPFDKVEEIVETFKEVKSAYRRERLPYMPGLHLEGPFFSQAQRGAQPPEYIYPPTPYMIRYLIQNAPFISQISMAPEVDGVLSLGFELSRRGVVVSIGHSDATFLKVMEAIEAGFSLVTHIYSGCSTVRRIDLFRVGGVVEAGLLLEALSVEVIGDGKHLPPSLLQLIFKNKGISRVVGITDSISATGLGEGEYRLGGKPIVVEDGVAKLKDRTAFAGSVAWTNQIVKNFRDLVGLSLEDAVKPLTVVPARLFGLYPERGVIREGSFADLTLFNDDIEVFYTIREGEIIYKKEEGL